MFYTVLGIILLVIGAVVFLSMILASSPFTSYMHGTFLYDLNFTSILLLMILALALMVGGVLCLVMF